MGPPVAERASRGPWLTKEGVWLDLIEAEETTLVDARLPEAMLIKVLAIDNLADETESITSIASK